MTPILETRRLRLREFSRHDLDELAAMVADEEQMRFYPGPRSRDEASAWIERNLALYEEHGLGIWLIESVSSSDFVGYCGIRPLSLDGAAETEIGWHVHQAFWSRGVATEAATAARDLAFTRWQLSRLVAIIPPDHLASRRVAENIGMRQENITAYEGDPVVVYASERSSTSPR